MTTTSLTIWPKIGSGCNTLTNHTYPHTTSPHFFLVLSGYRSTLHDMQSAYLPANASIRTWPDRRTFSLTEEREWYNEIPCCPMGSLPCSYSLSQSFSLQRAATKHGVYPDQVNPRSGACMYNTCAYYLLLPLLEKIHTTQRTREGDLDLGSWCFGILPVCLSCPPVLPAALITAEYESCSRLCICI